MRGGHEMRCKNRSASWLIGAFAVLLLVVIGVVLLGKTSSFMSAN